MSWSHYCELIGIKDENERKFYEKETVNSKWSTRELGRQIESGLYQRLLLSDGKANKEKVLQLAKEGQIIEKPKDIIKEPYVFEFLGIKEEKPLLEKDLEYKLIRQLEDFLLELGKGFMFVGSQQNKFILSKKGALENMSYAIIRNEKLTRAESYGAYVHNDRKAKNYSNKDIDRSKNTLEFLL